MARRSTQSAFGPGTRLARLLYVRGKNADIHVAFGAHWGLFTEAFQTTDPKDVKALLEFPL